MKDKIYLLYEATPSRLGEVPVLPNASKPTQRVKQNEETNVFQTKKQGKASEKILKVSVLTSVYITSIHTNYV